MWGHSLINIDTQGNLSNRHSGTTPRNYKSQSAALQPLEQACLKWYAKANKSQENLNNKWNELKQYEGFDKFQILLARMFHKHSALAI